MTDAAPAARDAAHDGPRSLAVGVAAIDIRGRILLLRQAPNNDVPGLWELPSTQMETGEPSEQAAQRALRELGLTSSDDATYAGHFEIDTRAGMARQLVFTARVASTDVVLSPAHDDYT